MATVRLSEAAIAIKEKINEKKARMRTLGTWETDKAYEIQQLIIQQAQLFDDICALEIQLAVEKTHEPN